VRLLVGQRLGTLQDGFGVEGLLAHDVRPPVS